MLYQLSYSRVGRECKKVWGCGGVEVWGRWAVVERRNDGRRRTEDRGRKTEDGRRKGLTTPSVRTSTRPTSMPLHSHTILIDRPSPVLIFTARRRPPQAAFSCPNRLLRGPTDEAHVSAQPRQARPHARVPRPHGLRVGAFPARAAPREGAAPPLRQRLGAGQVTPGGGPNGPGPAPARAEAGPEARRPLRMPRDRRLKRQRLIRPLFDRARRDVGRLSVGSVQLRWRVVSRTEAGADTPLQVGFTAGRRGRTKVGRNRVRRVMREAWRSSQQSLLECLGDQRQTLTVFALFRGNEREAEEQIRRDLPSAMAQLKEKVDDASAASPA